VRIRARTLLDERALSLGEAKDTKTRAHRTVRLLEPLHEDLLTWRMRSGRPPEIDELDEAPRIPAEEAIRAAGLARVSLVCRRGWG
jgi:hypothetical protein